MSTQHMPWGELQNYASAMWATEEIDRQSKPSNAPGKVSPHIVENIVKQNNKWCSTRERLQEKLKRKKAQSQDDTSGDARCS